MEVDSRKAWEGAERMSWLVVCPSCESTRWCNQKTANTPTYESLVPALVSKILNVALYEPSIVNVNVGKIDQHNSFIDDAAIAQTYLSSSTNLAPWHSTYQPINILSVYHRAHVPILHL